MTRKTRCLIDKTVVRSVVLNRGQPGGGRRGDEDTSCFVGRRDAPAGAESGGDGGTCVKRHARSRAGFLNDTERFRTHSIVSSGSQFHATSAAEPRSEADMRTGRSVWAGATALAICALPYPGRAEVLTYVTEGTIYEVHDPSGLIPFARLGDRATHTVRVDSLADSASGHPLVGLYTGIDSTLHAGDRVLTAAFPTLRVQDGVVSEIFDMTSQVDIDGMPSRINSRLSAEWQNAIPTPSLPLLPYQLDLFNGSRTISCLVQGPIGSDGYPVESWFTSEIDSFRIVPEPSCALSGLATLLVVTVHRSRQRH